MIALQDLARAVRHPDRLDDLLAQFGEPAVLARLGEERIIGWFAFARPDVPSLAAWRRAAVAESAALEAEEARIFGAFRGAGLRAAVFKGALLGQTHYPAPWCRARLDLDLLVDPADRHCAVELLTDLGYSRPQRVQGDLVRHQDLFDREILPGFSHGIDLHWQVSNRALFVQRLPARDLLQRSLPAFDGRVAGLCPADSLIVASIHRVGHHSDRTYLHWWHDVWLVGHRLDALETETYTERVRSLGFARLSAHDLREAVRLFGPGDGAVAPAVVARLEAGARPDLSTRFLAAGRTEFGDLVLDLRALPRWRDRIRLMREHLFPSPSFMQRADARSTGPLHWLYVRRIVLGGLRWIREAVARQ